MNPVEVTGFNRDLVVENTASGPPYGASASELNPGENRAFYQVGLPGKTYGLPENGQFLSATGDGTTFQFQSYATNNALVLSSGTGLSIGTLTLKTPAIFGRIAIVANSASASANSAGTVILTFADGTTYSATYNAPDWFNNSGYALRGVERIDLTSGSTSGATTNPRFYQTTLDLTAALGATNKPLVSLTFSQASSANATGIYAISGEPGPESPAVILAQPADTTVQEANPATFTASVGGHPPPSVQWWRNTAPIAGATQATLVLPSVTIADNSTLFRLVASNVASNISTSVTTRAAVLSVIADTNPPVLVRARSLGLTQVEVSLSERITPATATNKVNYTLSGPGGAVTVSSASLGSGQSNVTLTVATMADGGSYTLRVSGLTDMSSAANRIATNSQAVFIASQWIPADLGGSQPGGEVAWRTGGVDVTGGGVQIGGANDQCQFSYNLRNGDFDLRVRIESVTLTDPWAEAGLMVRESLAPGSRMASVLTTPTISGAFFKSRSTTNGAVTRSGSFPVNYPSQWLRLRREGSQFSGFASRDGLRWTLLGSASLSMPATVNFGYTVSSHNVGQVSMAAFRELANVTQVLSDIVPFDREPLSQCSRRTPLVISEIMYHPPDVQSGGREMELEFVEIFNSRGEPEDMSGFRLSGAIDFVFPHGTILPGGGFLVVARAPADLQTVHGFGGALGPWSGAETNGLPNDSGTVRLRHRTGAVLLEVSYADEPPWPLAADGAGHSLVLARPSHGERSPLAWAASDAVLGSPGRLDPISSEPLGSVTINEFLAHTDDPELDYIELYNHGNSSADISGCVLTDDASTNRFVIPLGRSIPSRGFVTFNQAELGFALNAQGETLYLKNASGTRVLDAVLFGGQENGVASGRSPDGAGEFYRLASKTPGTNNASIRRSGVVINELMYHPIQGGDAGQYVELFNQGPGPVNLGGWRLEGGVRFTCPSNTMLAANAYLVVARSAATLRAQYPHLTPGNCAGDFEGTLSQRGERIVLSMPDTVVTTNANGVASTNLIHIGVDEVAYEDGGQWGRWADGGGSSLELIDPRANGRRASNWGDSDETGKAGWTLIETTGVVDNGTVAADQLQVLLQGAGECLIDDVQVLDAGGTNRIANSTFESGTTGWTAQGTEATSGWESAEGYASARSYRIRAVDRGDNQVNRVTIALTNPLANGTTATIRARVRWLRGFPEIIFRLRGNWLEAAGRMSPPAAPGTPGLANSRRMNNTGPALFEIAHQPALPNAGQNVVVTARVQDPDGVGALTLLYRYDPAPGHTPVAMRDDGAGGDAVAGDKIFSGTIPGAAGGTLAAYHVQAIDQHSTPATALYPSDAPARECLVRFGETVPGGNIPAYRIWMTQATFDTWSGRLKLDNTPNPVTFVLGEHRVIHLARAQFAGSPYIAPSFNTPTGNRCGYSIEFPGDDPFLGGTDLVLDWPGGHGRENTAIQEQMAYWIADRLDLPFSHRHHIRLLVNGVTDMQRGGVFEAVLQPAGDFLDQWSFEDTDGDFFKIDRAFEFNDANSRVADPMPRLEVYQTPDLVNGGQKKKAEKYRWTWLRRSYDTVLGNTNLFTLVDALNAPAPEPYTAQTEGLVDIPEFMGMFAFEHIINNFDSWGHEIGKNMYMYKPADRGWQLYAFDLDWLMLVSTARGSGYVNGGGPLFVSEDPTVTRLYNHPPFRRAYLQTVQAAVDGPLVSAQCDPVMDAKYASLVANGVTLCDGQALADPSAVKTWFQQRRAYLQTQLVEAAAPFTVANPASFTVSSNLLTLSGTAPLSMASLRVNGVPWPVTWTSVTNWTARLVIGPGTNTLVVAAHDRAGAPVPGASQTRVVNLPGAVPSPAGLIAINEIQSTPAVPDAEFVELFNRSTNTAFDLSGWVFNGLDYSFPPGSYIGPGAHLVLVKDRALFNAAHGITNVPFGEFGGNLQTSGETLTLIRPQGLPAEGVPVAKVRYEGRAPWPVTTNTHRSLQLIDAARDNWRPGNWQAGPAHLPPSTPGGSNNVAAALPAFPALWINEIQPENLTGITNRAGQRVPWLEIYNPTTNAVSLAGLWLSTNYGQLGQWTFPTGSVINPGQFKVVFADGLTNLTLGAEWHANFALSPGAGTLALSRLATNGQWQVLDYITYTNITPNRSFGSFPDGQSFDRQPFYFVTPGSTNNRASQPISVLINEWMADNLSVIADPADGDFEDWFELYNPGPAAVDLSGFYLTDNLTNKFQFMVPNNAHYVLPPHGFLLVWADEETGQNSTNRADLHVSFKLAKTGEAIGLFAADGTAIDYVVFGPQVTDHSEGRYPDGGALRMVVPTPSPRGGNQVPPATGPPTITAFQYTAAGRPTLAFQTEPGHFYQVEYADSLTSSAWFPLGPEVMATGDFQIAQDPNPPGTRRFYRVVMVR